MVAKRDEHHAARCAIVGAGSERYAATARSDGHGRPSAQSKGREVLWMQRCNRPRLDRVQHFGAARHASRMPVFELAPGDKNKRVLIVGPLISGGASGWD